MIPKMTHHTLHSPLHFFISFSLHLHVLYASCDLYIACIIYFSCHYSIIILNLHHFPYLFCYLFFIYLFHCCVDFKPFSSCKPIIFFSFLYSIIVSILNFLPCTKSQCTKHSLTQLLSLIVVEDIGNDYCSTCGVFYYNYWFDL